MQTVSLFQKTIFRGLCCLFVALATFGGTAQAQTVVFQDDFSFWDTSKWTTYDSTHFLQRTQFGFAPTIATESGVTFARYRLDTYNSDSRYRGTYLRGTESHTRTIFQIGNGLEFEARLRGRNLPPGIVFAFFTYGERGTWPSTYLKEEIDFEFLTNFNKNEIWLNIWDDWNPERYGPSESSRTAAPGLDWSGWNTYKILWTPTATEWHVNGVVVRRSTNITPKDPMELRFNIWAADNRWTTAYDENLPVTSSSSANQSYYMDVDWVRVRTVPATTPTPTPTATPQPTPTPIPGSVVGNGTGLSATYFDNSDFTGTSLKRVDSQVNFDWGQGSPASTIGVDTYSARWTGKVQAQWSETYTFFTQSDDGVRLWVNNQLLINDWNDHGETENSGSITLVAGQKYSIKLEYYDNAGRGLARLLWSSARTPKQTIPRSQLYPDENDVTPPTITMDAPINGLNYKRLRTTSGTAADDTGVTQVTILLRDVTRSLYWNGSAWTSSTAYLPATGTTRWTFAMPPLSDSRYSITARAYDAAGNNTPVKNSFDIDTTGPQIIVTTPRANTTYASLASATGTASDKAGMATVRGKLWRPGNNTAWNGTTWVAATSLAAAPEIPASGTLNWTIALPPLPASTYLFQPLARDRQNNWSYGTPVSFTISGASALSTGRSVLIASPVTLSDAQIGFTSLDLFFTGDLGATAAEPLTWQLTVNTQPVAIDDVIFKGGSTVTLGLPDKTLKSGDTVGLTWPALRDTQGRLVGGQWSGVVR